MKKLTEARNQLLAAAARQSPVLYITSGQTAKKICPQLKVDIDFFKKAAALGVSVEAINDALSTAWVQFFPMLMISTISGRN